jgi:ATP-dependent DNA helicase RecQ
MVGGNKEKVDRLVTLCAEASPDSVLIYAATRKNTERYAQALHEAGVSVGTYHAGMSEEARSATQEAFMADELRAIVATNAFGMGVDKADIRRVVHADIPRSLEAYYQEAGRAGRDGLSADCILLFNHGDVRLQDFLIDASFPSAELLRSLWIELRGHPRSDLGALANANLPGSPHESTLRSALHILGRHGFLSEEAGLYSATKPEQLHGEFPEFDPEAPSRRGDVERSKLRQMTDYAYATACRHQFILDYFGDPDEADSCSSCDNCLGEGASQPLSDTELESALKLLDVVGALGGRFGRKRIVSIANGSDSDERFYGLPERGSLKGHTQKSLLDLLRSLEGARYLKQDRGEYPTIALTATGKAVTRGKSILDPDSLRLSSPPKTRRPTASRPDLPRQDIDQGLARRLAELRTRLAQERSVPAYVIFSNRTLDELSRRKPDTLAELATIHGIGPARIDSLGDEILDVIRES